MSEALKDFVPYTTAGGRKRYVNMSRVIAFGEETDNYGNPTDSGRTELIFAPGCAISAMESPEHFLGQRPRTAGHR